MTVVKILRFGVEEGDYCNREDCKGRIGFDKVYGCTCHMGHPPCGACTSQLLSCLKCGWEYEEDDQNIFDGIFGFQQKG